MSEIVRDLIDGAAQPATGMVITVYLGVKVRAGVGAWGGIVVARSPNGDVQETPISGLIGPSTGNKAWLVAAWKTMEHVKRIEGALTLKILAPSDYLNEHAQVRQLVNWKLDGWTKPSGDPVANAEDWDRIYGFIRELSPTLSRPATVEEVSRCAEAKSIAGGALKDC